MRKFRNFLDKTAEVPHIETPMTPANFEWDEDKAAKNLAKHKVSFPFARYVFSDPDMVTVNAIHAEDGEDRCKAIGLIDGRLYVVVFVLRGDSCRLISARRTRACCDRIYPPAPEEFCVVGRRKAQRVAALRASLEPVLRPARTGRTGGTNPRRKIPRPCGLCAGGQPFGGRSIHWIDRLSASPLRHSTDGTASLFAARLADCLARTQRRVRKFGHNRL